jgi:hypothetical protein
VEVSDNRIAIDDALTVDSQLEPQDTMGRRVLGPEVELHLLDPEKGLGLRRAIELVIGHLVTSRFRLRPL